MMMAVIAPFDSRIGAGFALNHGALGASARAEAAHATLVRRSMGVGADETSCTGALGRSCARAEHGVWATNAKTTRAAIEERGFTRRSLGQILGATE